MDKTIPAHRQYILDNLFESFSIVSDGNYVFLCDMYYDYSRWSEAAVTNFGLPSPYMFQAGTIWEEHIHPDDRAAYHKSIEAIFSGKESGHDMQYRALNTNGQYDVCTCRGILMRDKEGNPEYFGGAIRNHGQQSHIDSMTGFPNQYGFFEDLNSNIRAGKPVNIAMVGISAFREINELYGYLFGNSVLQKFGRTIFDYAGNRGCVYRMDGTRFCVMSHTETIEEMSEKYSALRDFCRDRFKVDGSDLILDLNAGFFSLDNFSLDARTVYTCLSFAYSESKMRRQGDPVRFFEELSRGDRGQVEMLHLIRESIPRNYRGFCLFYQPVVDAMSEKVIGAEALIRWNSPAYGTVMPDNFISFLERDSMFPELGRWILTTAIEASKEIRKIIPDFHISVNLSYTQLQKPDFADMVLDVLRVTSYPAEYLTLEVTERCRLLDMDLLENIFIRLKTAGIKFALDDFGTGFSSIGVLKKLPFDIIKIDRSFVQKIEHDDTERKLMHEFTNLASTFNAEVCVEGVETAGMRDILQYYPVSTFQGYLYSKPMDIEHFMDYIKEQQ